MQALMASGIKIYRAYINMGAYGGTTKKPTILYHSHPIFGELADRQIPRNKVFTKQLVRRYRDKSGKVKVVGTKQSLKHSQHYPPARLFSA